MALQQGVSEGNPGRAEPAIVFVIVFAIGIWLDAFGDLRWQLSFTLFLLSSFAWCISYFNQKTNLSAVLLMVAIASSGSLWHHAKWNWVSPLEISTYCQGDESLPVVLRAEVLDCGQSIVADPANLFSAFAEKVKTQFLIAPTAIRDGTNWCTVGGRCRLVVYGELDELTRGDDVFLYGSLMHFRAPSSPGQLDFKRRMRSENTNAIVHVLSSESVVLNSTADMKLQSISLTGLRKRFERVIKQWVPDQQAGFATAILLGNRMEMTKENRRQFMVTGTAHLLAISGLHLGILSSLFFIAFRFGLLSRRAALIGTILFVVFYVCLVQFRPPVLRAAILVTLFCVSRLIGRRGTDFNLLAIAGIFVLFINPCDLFELGPQLSFVAFGTLVAFKNWIVVEPSKDPIDRLIWNSRPMWQKLICFGFQWIRQLVLVSSLVWMMGLPLVATHFHLVTPIALIANPIVLLPMSVALFSGLFICVFGVFIPGLASRFGVVCGSALDLISSIIQFAADLNGGHWWTAGPSPQSIVVFYTLACCIMVCRLAHVEKWLVSLWLLWLIVGWQGIEAVDQYRASHNSSLAKVTFVDVGHGSCTVVEFPNGKVLVCDAGCLNSRSHASESVANYLWSQRIRHIDTMLVSHDDLDHFNGIPELLSQFTIGTLGLGNPCIAKMSEPLLHLVQECQDRGIPIRSVGCNDKYTGVHQTQAEILLPPDGGTDGNDNSDSVVMKLDILGWTIILPADLEGNGMQLLLGQPPQDCDIALMPHHGSPNSRPGEFLHWCKPEFVVLSSGRNKLDQAVMQQIVEAGASPIATCHQGTVRFIITTERLGVQKWCKDRWCEVDGIASKFHRQ